VRLASFFVFWEPAALIAAHGHNDKVTIGEHIGDDDVLVKPYSTVNFKSFRIVGRYQSEHLLYPEGNKAVSEHLFNHIGCRPVAPEPGHMDVDAASPVPAVKDKTTSQLPVYGPGYNVVVAHVEQDARRPGDAVRVVHIVNFDHGSGHPEE